MKVIIWVIAALIYLAVAQEERGTYKTCKDSSFCRRCRKVQGPSKYVVLPETLYTDSTSVTVEIKNNENNHLFLLKLSALEVCDCITFKLCNLVVFSAGQLVPLWDRWKDATEATLPSSGSSPANSDVPICWCHSNFYHDHCVVDGQQGGNQFVTF